MEQEKKENQRVSSRFRTKALLLVVVLLIGGFICFAISDNKLENQARIVLDKKMALGTRMGQFGELLDHLRPVQNGKSSLKIIPPEILEGFKRLILDKDDAMDLREIVAQVFLWRDPDREMKGTIATLIMDKDQPLFLRSEALARCTDESLVSAVIESDDDPSLRKEAIQRSMDKTLLQDLVKYRLADDMRMNAADRLCEIDKDWLRRNVIFSKTEEYQAMRLRLIPYCFSGDNSVLDTIFDDRSENGAFRALAIASMSTFPESLITNILLDKYEDPTVRATAIAMFRASWNMMR